MALPLQTCSLSGGIICKYLLQSSLGLRPESTSRSNRDCLTFNVCSMCFDQLRTDKKFRILPYLPAWLGACLLFPLLLWPFSSFCCCYCFPVAIRLRLEPSIFKQKSIPISADANLADDWSLGAYTTPAYPAILLVGCIVCVYEALSIYECIKRDLIAVSTLLVAQSMWILQGIQQSRFWALFSSCLRENRKQSSHIELADRRIIFRPKEFVG